jgi:2-dehydro-3-deoxyphosphogluconate aldolase/(4S)-4-hydroxy-2-oxoglutarate aldolase
MQFRDTESAIAAQVVLPVVREQSPERALEVAEWLIEQGLDVIELTASTPGWQEVAGELTSRRSREIIVGVGTVRTAADADTAIGCGARFLVTPCPAPAVREAAEAGRVPLLEGGLTPGEVLAAADRGIAKLFPAHVGGIDLLRSILALSPDARIVPTGGIRLADVPAWLEAGAYAVGIGSELRPDPDVGVALRDTLAAAR